MLSLPQHAMDTFSDRDVGPSLPFFSINYNCVRDWWWALLPGWCPAPCLEPWLDLENSPWAPELLLEINSSPSCCALALPLFCLQLLAGYNLCQVSYLFEISIFYLSMYWLLIYQISPLAESINRSGLHI